jgi:hypothetical protein
MRTRMPYPRMRPVNWLLLAVGFATVGLIANWFIINLQLIPLANYKPGIAYYTAEDRIFVDNLFQLLDCDSEHRLTDRIPMEPPFMFKHIKAGILYVCDKPGEETKWIYSLKTDADIQGALDHIEQLALSRDRMILGGLGLIVGVPFVFCIVAAIANRMQV